MRIYCIFIRILKSFHFIFLLRDLLLAASLSAPGDGDGEDDDDEEEVDAHQDDTGGQDDLVVPLLCDCHIFIFMFLMTQGQVTILLITRKDDPHERGRYFFRSLFYWQVFKIFALWDAAIFPWVSLSSKAPNTCDIGPWTPFFTLWLCGLGFVDGVPAVVVVIVAIVTGVVWPREAFLTLLCPEIPHLMNIELHNTNIEASANFGDLLIQINHCRVKKSNWHTCQLDLRRNDPFQSGSP